MTERLGLLRQQARFLALVALLSFRRWGAKQNDRRAPHSLRNVMCQSARLFANPAWVCNTEREVELICNPAQKLSQEDGHQNPATRFRAPAPDAKKGYRSMPGLNWRIQIQSLICYHYINRPLRRFAGPLFIFVLYIHTANVRLFGRFICRYHCRGPPLGVPARSLQKRI